MPSRRTITTTGILTGIAALLSSCGTIIYPDRVNQEERGKLDPLVIILDGVGLFFFIIPGVIAFAVDFATGSIYLPKGKESGDKEHTIFDDLSKHTPPSKTLNKERIEHVISQVSGITIDLARDAVHVSPLNHLDEFWIVYAQKSNQPLLAIN